MALPYAAFPKYGPSVLGQANYDAELSAWELYQASLRNPAVEEAGEWDDAPESDESDEPGSDLDTFTYLRKYVKPGQSRKRIFREQNIKALDADHALRQGRDAMVAELGPRYDFGSSPDGDVYNWKPVPGSEKAVKPRGRAFQQGEDDRRNEEGTNGSTGESRPDNMPASDERGSQEDPGTAKGEGQEGEGSSQGDENESSQGAGEGEEQESTGDTDGKGDGDCDDGEGGEDDTPKMPTCPECGEQRGTTEGCCAPKESNDIPKPEQPDEPSYPNLQLLRTDGQAPYQGEASNDKIQYVAHIDTVETLTESLGDVDTWTREVVKGAVHDMSVELYGAMAKSHTSLVARMQSGTRSNGLPVIKAMAQAVVDEALADFNVNFKPGITKEVVQDIIEDGLGKSIETIADLVADKLNAPRRIEVSMNGKVIEIEGTPHGAFDESLRAMSRGLDLFMVGPAGSGKGFLAQHLADALGQRFGFLSCSEGMSEGMLLGRGVPLADRFLYLRSSFVDFYENGGVFLLDEIDAANPNVLLIINECLSSPHLSIPNRVDSPYAVRHKEFYCIVAANTWGTGPDMEYVGRNRLDAAFLNRFIGSQIELGYDAKIEGAIAKAYMSPKKAEAVLKRFWGVRQKLVDLNIRRIWSTRGLEKMCIALAAGDDMHEVLDAHTRGWTADEKSKAGVLA